jgi:hypothetical protein
VDDVLFFCDGSRREVNMLKKILDLYCIASGMEINRQISSFAFNGVGEENVRRILQVFPFQKYGL